MASLGEALLTAALGVGGGLVGAGVMERLKAGVASLDTELMRLETLEDDLFDAFECPSGDDARPAKLRHIAGCRRRLGQNIRRKVTESTAYEACKAGLVRFDGFLARAEDAEALNEDLEAQIQTTVAKLRHHLQRSSRTARIFALLRGDA